MVQVLDAESQSVEQIIEEEQPQRMQVAAFPSAVQAME